MVPPSRGSSGAAGRQDGKLAGVATLTSKRIGEAGILNFLGTNAYRRRYFR